MVDIREYWMDSEGDLKPGKKGTTKQISHCILQVLSRYRTVNGPMGKAKEFCN